jgi:hypothetical protein
MPASNRSRTRSGNSARKKAQVALQKAVTAKLMTPGSKFAGLQGQTGGRFDGTSTVLNNKPAVLVKDVKFQDGANSFGKEGYVPNTIQLGGTTLYGLQQGNNVVFSPKTKTPLMESFKAKIETPDPDPDPDPDLNPDPDEIPTPLKGPRLDPNATERYASNFKAGQANMSDIQEMYADRKDLQEWAKANPALAQKEFAKSGFQSTRMKNADIQDQMDDTGRSRDDLIAINNGGLETVIDGSSIGKSTPQDAQAFKDAAAQLVIQGQLPSSMNAGSTPIIPGVTPMFEGNELSTAIEPGYKSEMADGVMNQLAKGLDIPTTRFASQDLKDLFMNNLLGK